MCGVCKATGCKKNKNEDVEVGASWVGRFGKYTCTEEGVEWTKGCSKDGKFYKIGDTFNSHRDKTYSFGVIRFNYKYTCKKYSSSAYLSRQYVGYTRL